jgi:hypothetical protein
MPGNVYVYRESQSTDAECAPARLKVRKNIDFRTAQELADFRRAVKQASDDNGFDYFAGWHGATPPVPA